MSYTTYRNTSGHPKVNGVSTKPMFRKTRYTGQRPFAASDGVTGKGGERRKRKIDRAVDR
jgi:hypothetical protein